MTSISPIRRVVVVGGTHGNETNGVLLASHLQKHHKDVLCAFAFQCDVVLANTAAVAAQRRYCDEDLNRCFSLEKLKDPSRVDNTESHRAKEINALIGPKGEGSAADYVIDLHNTTANTGVALLYRRGDVVSDTIAAYLQAVDPSVRVCEWTPGVDPPMLASVGKAGMTFEVGPVPQVCADGALYLKTKRLVMNALQCLDAISRLADQGDHDKNGFKSFESQHTLSYFTRLSSVDYPRDSEGNISAIIHPSLQGKDFQPLQSGAAVFWNLDDDAPQPLQQQYSHDVYPFFINEAAYYEKGVAFALAKSETKMIRIPPPP